MRRRKQEIGLSLVYLVCFSWFASSCALGKTMASDSLQEMQSAGIPTRRIEEVEGANSGHGGFIGRKLISEGGGGGGGEGGGGGGGEGGGGRGEGGGESNETPRSGGGGGRVPGGGAAANNTGGHHHNGGTSYARNCLGSPTFILTLLASCHGLLHMIVLLHVQKSTAYRVLKLKFLA